MLLHLFITLLNEKLLYTSEWLIYCSAWLTLLYTITIFLPALLTLLISNTTANHTITIHIQSPFGNRQGICGLICEKLTHADYFHIKPLLT